jgi:pimeloyl-ACP methyl ester carboxylesterase
MSTAIEHVTIHGQRVAYRHCGAGPVLLLIHGMAASSRVWDAVVPALASDFTIVAPDLVGHGESASPPNDYSIGGYASGLRDLLSLLEIERATLIGTSLGGGIAMQMAYQYPETCERLVLVDSGGLGREVSWVLRSLSFPGLEYLMPVLFPTPVRGWGDAAFRFLHGHGIRADRIESWWQSYASLTDPVSRQVFLRTVRAVIDPGGQAVCANDRLYLAAQHPTLIVWGSADKVIPVNHAMAAHAAIPGSRLEIIEGAGHSPYIDQPERFAEVVRDFVATTEPAATGRAELAAALRAGAAAS